MSRDQKFIVFGIVGAALTAFVLVAVLATFIIFVSGNVADKPTARSVQPMSREQFKTKFIGKTKGEVMDALGRPARTSQDYGDYWNYQGDYTRDAINGKPDSAVTIWFGADGAVTQVTFTP